MLKKDRHVYPVRREVLVFTLCDGVIAGFAGDCWCDVDEDLDADKATMYTKKMIQVTTLEPLP